MIDSFKGGSLFDRIIKHGQLSEHEAAMISSRLFSAVKHMHKNGYVHRNIRPETVLFESDNALSDVKLVDLISVAEIDSVDDEEDYT